MNRKKREGIVYSTNPDFTWDQENPARIILPPGKQLLYIWVDARSRKGKTVSIIRGFEGSTDDLESLAKEIKTGLGTGGSVKNGEIIIQGDFREKIIAFLSSRGYRTRKAGG